MKTCPACTYANGDQVETCWKCGRALGGEVFHVAGLVARATVKAAARPAAPLSFAAKAAARPVAPPTAYAARVAPRLTPCSPAPPALRVPLPAPPRPALCEMCRAPLATGAQADRVCPGCGWDNDRHARR